MKKSDYLKAIDDLIQDDQFTAVTLIADEESLSIVGNMTWDTFEDLILQLAEDIADQVQEFKTVH
jgi:hypothetical protein